MSRTRPILAPPRGLVARVRWLFLLLAVLVAGLLVAALVVVGTVTWPLRAVGVLVLLLLCLWWARGYARGGFPPAGVAAEGLALLVVGAAAGDPASADGPFYVSLLYAGLLFRALYGSAWRVLLAALAYLGALFGAAALSSDTGGVGGLLSPLVSGEVPGLVLVPWIAHALIGVLEGSERAAQREGHLGRAAAALVAVEDRETVREMAVGTAAALVPEAPGAQSGLWEGSAERMDLVAAAGDREVPDGGARMDVGRLPDRARARLLEGEPAEAEGDDAGHLAGALGLDERAKTAFVAPLFGRAGLMGVLAVSGDRALDGGSKNGLQTLGAEVALALEGLALKEDLRGNERSLAAAQRIARLGGWEADFGSGTARWSDEMYRIYGFEPQEFDPTQERFLGLVHPDDRASVEAYFRKSLEEGDRDALQCRVVRPDGEVRVVENHREVRLDEAGEPVGLSGTVQDITERKRAEEALRRSEERYRAVVERSMDGIFLFDGDTGRVLDTNPALHEMLGYAPGELRGMHLHDLVAHDPGEVDRNVRLALGEGHRFVGDRKYRKKDGSILDVEVGASTIPYDGREVVCAIVRDTTERKRAEEELRRSERELAEAQRIAHVGNWSMEVAENRLDWSDEMYRIAGFAPREFAVTVEGFLGLVQPDDRESLSEAVRAALRGDEDRRGLDFRLVRPGGEVRHLHTEYEVERDGSGRPVRLLGATQDVTERKALEGKLEHQALHDPLTGLPNRALFSDRLGHALSRAERGGGEVAVLFVDLDNFKYVNDSLGHEAGDRLLVTVADRLRAALRPGDTAARLGGDEFAVLLEGVGGAGEAERVAGRIVEGLREPFALEGGQEVYVTPSIGIATGGGPGGGAPEDLLRRADLAMYEAKRGGKARYAVFDPETERRSVRRLRLENGLRRAIERDELVVRYQPVVRLSSGRIAGFEALVRWEHPERGLILPEEFVPLAEETGLIVPIGQKVLGEACRQAKGWRTRHPGFADPPLVVGVNLSPRQLSHPGLVGDVKAALDEAGLDPGRLTLEITEGALVDDGERCAGTLRGLKNLGVRLALDDFGTGYSSLSYLRRLPVGLLKIDRSFVERLGQDPEDVILLSGVVGIAHGLGLLVCAEGVETAEQAARAKTLGCDLAQGNLFSEPLPPEVAGALLAGGSPSWRPPRPVSPPRGGAPPPGTGS